MKQRLSRHTFGCSTALSSGAGGWLSIAGGLFVGRPRPPATPKLWPVEYEGPPFPPTASVSRSQTLEFKTQSEGILWHLFPSVIDGYYHFSKCFLPHISKGSLFAVSSKENNETPIKPNRI